MIILVVAGLFAIAIAGSKPMTAEQIQAANDKQFRGSESVGDNIGKLVTLLLLR